VPILRISGAIPLSIYMTFWHWQGLIIIIIIIINNIIIIISFKFFCQQKTVSEPTLKLTAAKLCFVTTVLLLHLIYSRVSACDPFPRCCAIKLHISCFVRVFVLYLVSVFDSRVLRRIFGPRRYEVTEEWRNLHSEDLHDLYSTPNTVRVIRGLEL